MKEEVYTEKAPKPVGPYSQAVKVGNLLFLAGQIGIDPLTGRLEEGLYAQTKRALENAYSIVLSAGGSKESIVRVVVYLKDLASFSEFNKVYEEFFQDVKVKPARTTVGVSDLPLFALVELEITAII